jgi:hypothetical protein
LLAIQQWYTNTLGMHMITLHKIRYLVLWVVLIGFLLLKTSFGQTPSATQPTPIQPPSTTLQTFLQEQQSLAQTEQALVAHGATEQQIQAWRTQNAGRLEAQQQRAQDMAAESAVESMPVGVPPNIPANASPTLKDFMTTQAALGNARAQIHNQLLRAMPGDVTEEQIGEMQQKEEQLFQQQYAEDLKVQAQRAQTLAQESSAVPLPVPGPLQIPPEATPQLAAFLTLRDQLMREEIALRNQCVASTPASRDAALDQWHRQNASRFQQLQTLAQNLSAATSN